MDYLRNWEIKFTIKLIFFIGIISIFINMIFINIGFNHLKKNYISTQGAILSRIEKISPDVTKDIVPLITREVSQDEITHGEKILSNYGIDLDLDIRFIPKYYEYEKYIIVGNGLMWGTFILFAVIVSFYGFRDVYKKIRKLKRDMENLINGKSDEDIYETLEGDVGKLFFTFNDIRKRLNSNIENLNNKKVFLVNLLSDISHQLKTPLSSLMLFNDILIDRENEITVSERTMFLNNSRIQLSKMDWLIKSLLKLAKIDAGAIIFNKSYCSLNETIKSALDVLYGSIIEKDIRIDLDEKNIYMNHDGEWLSEAFINIIKNSIEHLNNGGYIKINLEDNSMFQRVIIEDNGCGIDKKDIKKIFIRFYKNSKSKESIGIGLSLSKSIIEAHGGIIEVESEVEKYTRFTITFLK